MEGVFSLPVAVRTEFIHSLMQSLGGCSYICLWTYDTILQKYINIKYIYMHTPTYIIIYKVVDSTLYNGLIFIFFLFFF